MTSDALPSQHRQNKIRIGTSGYHYADWKGVFYPSHLRASDYLEFYSSHFNALELNSSFYRIPTKTQMETMVDRAGPDMLFSVKAFRQFTHGEIVPEDINAFKRSLDPLAASGKLGTLLFQFPYSFHESNTSWARIDQIAHCFSEFANVIEFRHSSWINRGVFCALHERKLGFSAIDSPVLQGLPGIVSNLTSDVGYVRFHGRNAAKWWTHDHPWERYDYLYSDCQLAKWKPRLDSMTTDARIVFAFFNNHYRGQAVQNAQMLKTFWKD